MKRNLILDIVSQSTLANVLTTLLVSQSGMAAGLNMNAHGPTESEVYLKIAELRTSLKQIHPTNSVSMSACEEKSGAVFHSFPAAELSAKSFVYCIVISTQLRAVSHAVDQLVAHATTGSSHIVIHVEHQNTF